MQTNRHTGPARGRTQGPVSPDLLWIGTFSKTAEALTPSPLPITDPKVLVHLQSLPSRVGEWGRTNLSAGLGAAMSFLSRLPRPIGRKVVVVGDGEANEEVERLPDWALALRQHFVSVRAIDVGNGAGRKTLQDIADATVGGRYDVARDYAQLAEYIGMRGKSRQTRTFATALLVDVSPSMAGAFEAGMTRIQAAQRAAAEWVATQVRMYGGQA